MTKAFDPQNSNKSSLSYLPPPFTISACLLFDCERTPPLRMTQPENPLSLPEPSSPSSSNQKRRPPSLQPSFTQLDLADAPPFIKAAFQSAKFGNLESSGATILSVGTPCSPGHSESYEDGSPTAATIRRPQPEQQLPRPRLRSFTITTGNSSAKSLSEAEISALMCRYFSVRSGDEASAAAATATSGQIQQTDKSH